MQKCWFCIFLQFLCIFFAHCGPKIFLKLETGFEVTGYSIGTKYGRPNWHKHLAPTVATGSELLWLWSNLSDKKCCRMLLLGDVESSFKLLICGIITWNWTGLNVALEAGAANLQALHSPSVSSRNLNTENLAEWRPSPSFWSSEIDIGS